MTMTIEPMMAANAAVFAIKNATAEGKITVIVLLLLSLFQLDDHPEQVPAVADRARRDQKISGGVCIHARSAGHPTPKRGVRWRARVSTLHPGRG